MHRERCDKSREVILQDPHKQMKHPYILLVAVGVLVSMSFLQSLQNSDGFELQSHSQSIKGVFLRNNEAVLAVDLELATTPKQIEQGLMHRTSLAPNTGMLFVFPDEQERAFWMRNTLTSLDMIFVTSTGRITNIHSSVPPHSEELRRSIAPTQYVVELPSGTAKKQGIQAGDIFQWRYNV